MSLPSGSHDPENLVLLTQAFNAALQEILAGAPGCLDADSSITRRLMALRIMAAVNEGERDLEKLKLLALQAVGGGPVN